MAALQNLARNFWALGNQRGCRSLINSSTLAISSLTFLLETGFMNPIAKGLLASIGLSTLLGAIALPVVASPFYPSRYRGGTLRDYETCTSQLLDLELEENLTALACGTAYRPRDLSDCVSGIATGTDISATTALESCRQVRRPLDLATCTVGIAETTNGVTYPTF